MHAKFKQKRLHEVWRKEGEVRSRERKHVKRSKQNVMAQMYREMANEINAKREAGRVRHGLSSGSGGGGDKI